MTRNQIDYARHLETRRTNLVNEELVRQRDLRNYELGVQSQAEIERANRERELFNRDNLLEVSRHNQAAESMAISQLEESKRHNLTVEDATRMQNLLRERELSELNRTNLAREAETNRHNLAAELETLRSNRAHESETIRSNKARESESHRANVASEQIARSNVGLRAQELEQKRKELEDLNVYRRDQLSMSRSELEEVIRNNQMREAETQRHNEAVESESYRSNTAKEKLGWFNSGVEAAGTAGRLFSSVIGGIRHG